MPTFVSTSMHLADIYSVTKSFGFSRGRGAFSHLYHQIYVIKKIDFVTFCIFFTLLRQFESTTILANVFVDSFFASLLFCKIHRNIFFKFVSWKKNFWKIVQTFIGKNTSFWGHFIPTWTLSDYIFLCISTSVQFSKQRPVKKKKETRALYHAYVLRYFAKKLHTLKKQIILLVPTEIWG
jgi:hypothetical protein